VKYVDVDTAFHPGNYPTACAVEATLSEEVGTAGEHIRGNVC
jgi:allantoicase